MDKILISPSTFGKCSPEPVDILRKSGLELIFNPFGRRLTPSETISLAKDCAGIIAGVEKYDKNTLLMLKNLKVISRVGVGLENIDLVTAENLGIIIKNTPDAPTEAVAELTIGLIFNLIRCICQQDRLMHMGKWEKKMGVLLSEKTVGIIGIGRIGRRVATILKGMGVKIVAYDINPEIEWASKYDIKLMPLNNLLAVSDIVTLHISHRGVLINERELNIMKKGSYLINVSRGEVVDETALCNALSTNRLSGAAVDVFENEPYSGPLTKLDNIILTAHIGSYTEETRLTMEMEAVFNLLEELKNHKLTNNN